MCVISSAAAQTSAVPAWRLGVTSVVGITRIDPSPNRNVRTDAFLEQPVVMARLALLGDRLRVHGTLNLEGLSMPDGVVTTGAFGEGFFDKRHPHTYAHEILAVGTLGARHREAVSLAVGKGFVAFGTDDPMNRPALRFPVNHHFSQIVERAVSILGVRAGPLALEGTLFNGDEPERPSQGPNLRRFGDSWAVRATLRPARVMEGQVSFASVASPEHRPGAGPTQRKANASLRVDRTGPGERWYALVEWARTSDAGGFFVFHSLLAEFEIRRRRHRPYYRFERTERPEEERLLDPFRSVRPHLDDNILGITRWTIHTVGYGVTAGTWGGLRVEPLVEVAYGTAANVGGGVLRPEEFYGNDTIVSVTVGVRVRWGRAHRVGRYGVLDTHEPQMAERIRGGRGTRRGGVR